jgi:hypothetical protein
MYRVYAKAPRSILIDNGPVGGGDPDNRELWYAALYVSVASSIIYLLLYLIVWLW